MGSRLRLKRVAIVGAESTGKSTLSQAVGRHLGWPVQEEAARLWAERVARPLTAFDTARIASMHVISERRHRTLATRLGADGLLLDTDLYSTRAYAWHYHRLNPAWLRQEAAARRADLYFLCRCESIAFRPDGHVRGRDSDREDVEDFLRLALNRAGACVVELGGDPGTWAGLVKREIESLRQHGTKKGGEATFVTSPP